MKVIVIGAGLMGLLTARELAQSGCDVLVLDQSTPGRESSWAGGGILSPLYPWRYGDAVNRLARWGQRYYAMLVDELEQETGMDAQWTQSGMIVLDGDITAATAFAEKFSMPMKVIDSREFSELEPEITKPTGRSILFPSIAQVRNPRLVRALMASCLKLGVEICSDARVVKIEHSGDRVTGVTTPSQTYSAETAVIASGAWSGDLLQDIGVSLPVYPVRGQMILFKSSPGLIDHIVLSEGHYLIPRRDGRVLTGSTLEQAGFDKSTTDEAVQLLFEFATDLCPALLESPIEHHWAGLRPGQPGDTPYICSVPSLGGLFLNTGHYRNGVVLGPASARLIADLILERTPLLDPFPYSLERGQT